MTPTERLAAIEARAQAATPGPWEWRVTDKRTATINLFSGDLRVLVGHEHAQDSGISGYHQDREFVAAAREDVPWLVERVRALEGALLRHVPAVAWKQGRYPWHCQGCGAQGLEETKGLLMHWPHCEWVMVRDVLGLMDAELLERVEERG